MNCIYCDHKGAVVKNGLHRGSQRYLCKTCKKTFVKHERKFGIGSEINQLFESYLNATHVSITQFAEATGFKRSTIYKHFNKAGFKSIRYLKVLSSILLDSIHNNTDAVIAKLVKLKFDGERLKIVLSGGDSFPDRDLFELHPTSNSRVRYQMFKVDNGNLELLITNSAYSLATYIKQNELHWISLSERKFRSERKKFKKVHM